MSIQLSLAAFLATFFPMLLAGIGLGVWAARRPKKRDRESNGVDTRATLDGSVQIRELLEKCKRKEI